MIALGSAGILSFENASEVERRLQLLRTRIVVDRHVGGQHWLGNWPVTTEGRVLAKLLSIYGLAMFGYITATFASFFVGRDAEEATGPLPAGEEVKQLLKKAEPYDQRWPEQWLTRR